MTYSLVRKSWNRITTIHNNHIKQILTLTLWQSNNYTSSTWTNMGIIHNKKIPYFKYAIMEVLFIYCVCYVFIHPVIFQSKKWHLNPQIDSWSVMVPQVLLSFFLNNYFFIFLYLSIIYPLNAGIVSSTSKWSFIEHNQDNFLRFTVLLYSK